MSLIGATRVLWVVDESDSAGFQCKLVEYVFQGYQEQHNTQVALAVQEVCRKVLQYYQHANEIILQSDNTSCFSSQKYIPFLYHMNKAENMHRIFRRFFH